LIHNESVLGIIPARGGSKRCPMKNITLYRGKPLLWWAIEAGLGSAYIDDLIVSSDDDNILQLAADYKVPALKRPEWLSHDRAMTEGVAIHLLYTHRWADWIVLLQPTSPLRTSADVDKCIERAEETGYAALTVNEHGSRNGAVYVARSDWLISRAQFDRDIDRNYLIMPNNRSLDIDYAIDFKFDPEAEIEPAGRELMKQQWGK